MINEKHEGHLKLTRYEKETLERMFEMEFQCIGRNENNDIVGARYSTIKGSCSWLGSRKFIILNHDFDFIQWKDSKLWDIQELLENCEVEE